MSPALQGVLERLDELERLLPGFALLYEDRTALRASVAARLQDIVRDAPDDARLHIAPRITRILQRADELPLAPRVHAGRAPDTTA